MNELKELLQQQWHEFPAVVQAAAHRVLEKTLVGVCDQFHDIYQLELGWDSGDRIEIKICKCFSSTDMSSVNLGDKIFVAPPQIVEPQKESPQVNDLVMIIKKLVRHHPDADYQQKVYEYLSRNNLQGSVLRTE